MMTLKDLAGLLSEGCCGAIPVGQIPILGDFAKAFANEYGKKLVAHFQDSVYHIQKKLRKL